MRWKTPVKPNRKSRSLLLLNKWITSLSCPNPQKRWINLVLHSMNSIIFKLWKSTNQWCPKNKKISMDKLNPKESFLTITWLKIKNNNNLISTLSETSKMKWTNLYFLKKNTECLNSEMWLSIKISRWFLRTTKKHITFLISDSFPSTSIVPSTHKLPKKTRRRRSSRRWVLKILNNSTRTSWTIQ